MSRDEGKRGKLATVHAGLCASCRHARDIESDRGSVFLLCGRSRYDSRYARYPALPVWRCKGYEAHEAGGEAGSRAPSEEGRGGEGEA